VSTSRIRPAVWCVGLLVLLPGAALAGTISIVLATRVSASASSVRVELDLRNQGDEAALNVQPTVEFQGRVVPGDTLPSLAPLSTRTVTFDLPLAGAASPRGVWPVLVRVRHTDSSGYPFEAIHVDLARFGEAGAASVVRIDVPDARVETETTIRARIDRGDVAGPVRIAFATPTGVLVTPRIVTFEPGADSTVAVTIATTGATVTSRLPLVTMAEYDTADGHQTVTAVSAIDIGPSDGGSRIQMIAILIVVAIVGGAVIALRTRRQ
jgi:hypothetical protein